MLPNWPKITWLYSNRDSGPFILGINPWIYDFAAFNLWSRPIGLIAVLSYLHRAGANVAILDCMYKTWQEVSWPKVKSYGTGNYPKVPLPKPYILKDVPRRFARYGLPYELVKGALKKLTPPPDIVLITSIMTYWYPGVVSMVKLVRELYPKTPIVVGGIYATLCFEHAKQFLPEADILKGPVESEENWARLWSKIGLTPPKVSRFDLSIQAELYPEPVFGILMLSRGCPFGCEYCASKLLFSKFVQRNVEEVFYEFEYLSSKGIKDFAFYDDALLVSPERSIVPFLEMVLKKRKKVNFHVPNGLHVRYLTKDICNLLKKAGFVTIRLGLETSNFKNRWDKKLTQEEWEKGITNLFSAGFDKKQIGVYILFGVPGQTEEEIYQAIMFVKKYGLRPHLAYYSPIPHTPMFEKAKEITPYPIDQEPLTHNRSIWPCFKVGFSWEERSRWKTIIEK